MLLSVVNEDKSSMIQIEVYRTAFTLFYFIFRAERRRSDMMNLFFSVILKDDCKINWRRLIYDLTSDCVRGSVPQVHHGRKHDLQRLSLQD